MYEKYFTTQKTKTKNGFVIQKQWEEFGVFNPKADYLIEEEIKDNSKSDTKLEIHKGKENIGNGITPLVSNTKDNTTSQNECDWEVVEQHSSLLSLRHKRTRQPLAIIDTDIIADHSLTLQEKVTEHTLRQGSPDRHNNVPF